LKVTLAETQAAVDRMVKIRRMPADAAGGYLPQFVIKMIQERAIASAYEAMGIRITDEEVLIGLISVYPQFFQNGKLTSKDQLEHSWTGRVGGWYQGNCAKPVTYSPPMSTKRSSRFPPAVCGLRHVQ